MTVIWNAKNAAHLLRRATFVVRPADVAGAVKAGMAATIAGLFRPPEPDSLDTTGMTLPDLQSWWLRRMANTTAPLTEKLTLMWHNQFATGFDGVASINFMYQQNQALRRNAFGNFHTLTLEVVQTAATLKWLDNDHNTLGHINQNLGRELMDCFTTGVADRKGVPTYTETDVQQAARALTGWGFDAVTGAFRFSPNLHDNGVKTFRGLTGNLGGEDIIRQLAQDAATARNVAWRLWTTFAGPVDLADPVLNPLEAAYLAGNMEIRPVIELMFGCDAFYAAKIQCGHVKNPCEWLVGSVLQLGGQFAKGATAADQAAVNATIGTAIQMLGQPIFNPPSVFGWDENMAWLCPSGVLNRLRVAHDIGSGQAPSGAAYSWDPVPLLPPATGWPALDAAATVSLMAGVLGISRISQTTVGALVDYLNTDINGKPLTFTLSDITLNTKLRGLVGLMLASPEYQFC